MIEIVHVTQVKPLGQYRLDLSFSDGSSGTHDFTDVVGEQGPMVEPLRETGFFQRVFISLGVLTWPNGYDVDSIRLHDDMKRAGELSAKVQATA